MTKWPGPVALGLLAVFAVLPWSGLRALDGRVSGALEAAILRHQVAVCQSLEQQARAELDQAAAAVARVAPKTQEGGPLPGGEDGTPPGVAEAVERLQAAAEKLEQLRAALDAVRTSADALAR